MKIYLILGSLFFYLGDKLSYLYNISNGKDFSSKVTFLCRNLGKIFGLPVLSFKPKDMLVGLIFALFGCLLAYTKSLERKNLRPGLEYGSARWGNKDDIAPYIDADFDNNILLTSTERLTMNSRPKSPKYARNKNVLVIGGSGSGKTRFLIKPNIMQLHSSYVVTDPKGTLINETGQMLYDNGYDVKVFNTVNFEKSMHYNPFAYLKSDKDILKLANVIIANTKGEGEKSSEDFWVSTTCSQAVKSLRTA